MKLRFAVFGLVALLAIVSHVAASVSMPEEIAHDLYKQGKPEEGRKELLRFWSSGADFYAATLFGSKVYNPQLGAELVRRDLGISTQALTWEKDLGKAKDGSDGPLALVQAARTSAEVLYKGMLEHRKPAEEAYFYDRAAFDLATILRAELQQLGAANKVEEAEKLRQQYAKILAMKEPVPDPDSEAIIAVSCAQPGPLQRVGACYRMKMPEQARTRFITLLEGLRDEAVAAASKGEITAKQALFPQTMVEHTHFVIAYERALTNETTSKQFFPAGALPTLEKAAQICRETCAALTKAGRLTDSDFVLDLDRMKNALARAKADARPWPPGAAPATAPAAGVGEIDWGRAKVVVTGTHLEICRLIEAYFSALAAEDAVRLKAVMAEGPEYLTPEGLVAKLAAERSAGKFDKILGYTAGQGTEYRFVEDGQGLRVLVTGLQCKVSIKGKVVSGENSEQFKVVPTPQGMRLGVFNTK